MMRRVLVCLALVGCADVHLGDDYGKRTRAVFQAQADAAGAGDSMIDAEDAKLVLLRHRNKVQQPGASQSGQMIAAPLILGTAGGGTAAAGGGSVVAPMKLDSVR
jgi:hypothetical protein